MMHDNLIRIRHMLDAADEILEFVAGKERADLNDNRMLSLAIIKELEIIGEAASKLSSDFKAEHSYIPWTDIVCMRNRLTHGYFDIDLDRVWDTIQEDLKPLRDLLLELANGI